MRLIDANNLGVGKANPDAFDRKDYAAGWNSALQAVIESAPTMDPETLPIVKELREQLERVTAERDAAVADCFGRCDTCIFEHDCAKHDNNDTSAGVTWHYDCEEWEWRGIVAENATNKKQCPKECEDCTHCEVCGMVWTNKGGPCAFRERPKKEE